MAEPGAIAEVLGAIDNALEGAVDGLRRLESIVAVDSPAFAHAAALVGALMTAQTHLQARVVPACRALESPPSPPGDPSMN